MVLFSFSIKKAIMAGSMLPQRVPIARPSSGVKPMLVSTDFPPFTAVMLAPLPRWQVIILRLSKGLPTISAALSATYLCEVPWNPYFLTPYFL